MPSAVSPAEIRPVDPGSAEAAARLLDRFFSEEGFAVVQGSVRANLEAMIADPHH